MIRVLIVEPHRAVGELLQSLLQRDRSLAVIGCATDDDEALMLTLQLMPDVIALGLHAVMGAELVGRIMEDRPTPIVVISASNGQADALATFRALELGAVSVFAALPTPGHPRLEALGRELAEMLRSMAGIKLVTRRPAGQSGFMNSTMSMDLEPDADLPRLLAVAASTGGPQALAALLRDLPASFPLPVLVVQHISPGFVNGMVDWLGESSALEVRVAQDGETIEAGAVLVAPDGQHLTVEQFGARLVVKLEASAPVARHRPSADPLFASVARVLGRRAVGLVLTGMGSDGAEGLRALHAAGSLTLVQEPRSCVVDSMPRAAIEAGGVSEVVPLAQLARRLRQAAVTPVTPSALSSGLMSLDPIASPGGGAASGPESDMTYKAVRKGGKP